nr:Wzz/FepE/Etk N-terminal domain-containing protein [Marinicella sp. W31]MDC2875962.1 Wzz/FepE/Etk N-terminal domain-containing protein [Marinicella sp. W31]
MIDILSIALTVWRGKWAILIITLITIAIGTYYAYRIATPLYNSSAIVMLNTQKERVVDIPSVLTELSSDKTAIFTEIEVLKSRVLIGKVVDELNLVEDPEFNATLRPKTLPQKIKATIRSFLSQAGSASGDETTDADREMLIYNGVVSSLLSKIEVAVVANTTAYSITAESESGKKAALIADTIAQEYVQNQIDVKRDATVEAIAWLTDQVGELQVALEQSEIRVKDFKAAKPMISAELLTGLERQLKAVRDRIAEMTKTAQDLGSLVNLMENASSYAEKVALSSDSRLSDLAGVAALDTSNAAEFEARFSQLIEQARTAETRVKNQLSALRNSQTDIEKQVESRSQELIELQQLTREAEATRLLYEYF